MTRRWGFALLLLAASPLAAQSYHRLGRRGLDSLRRSVAVDSVDAEAYYRLGLGLWERHRYDAADSALQRALHFQPWHAGAHLALSILPAARGDRYLTDLGHKVGKDSIDGVVRESRRHAALATIYDPRVDFGPLWFLRDDQLVPGNALYLEGEVTGAYYFPPAPRLLRAAARALADRSPDSAFAMLDRALRRRRPTEAMSDQFIALYATAAFRSSHLDAAVDGYRELAQREERREQASAGMPGAATPRSEQRSLALLLYGMAAGEDDRPAIAEIAFHEALLADLTLPLAHSRLADLAERAGDLELALRERRAAIAVAPDEGRPYLDLGITLFQAGRVTEAKDALLDAARRLPWDPGTQLFLFQAAMAAGDRATAQRALAALDLFAPRRNSDQVADAHRRFDGAAAQ